MTAITSSSPAPGTSIAGPGTPSQRYGGHALLTTTIPVLGTVLAIASLIVAYMQLRHARLQSQTASPSSWTFELEAGLPEATPESELQEPQADDHPADLNGAETRDDRAPQQCEHSTGYGRGGRDAGASEAREEGSVQPGAVSE